FFFQAEDGIRDFHVTGVQTCALPILGGRIADDKLVSNLANSFILNPSNPDAEGKFIKANVRMTRPHDYSFFKLVWRSIFQGIKRSEERRVGKECVSRWRKSQSKGRQE